MERRTVEQETADFLERNRRGKAFSDLMNKAHRLPDMRHEPADIAKRAGVSTARARRIMEDYRTAPHVHAVATMHGIFGGRGCKLGVTHPGCCPKAHDCDAEGTVGRYPGAMS
jgi:hypothetical protein